MNTETVVEKKPSPLPTEISKYGVAGKKSLSKNMVENREEADFKAFNDFYEAGKVALPFNHVTSNSNLSEGVKSSAYFAGVNDGQATANYKQGGLIDSSVNNAQGSFVDEFGKATGTQVHIVPTIADEAGASLANGQIKGADIFVAEDTENSLFDTSKHEVAHRVEQLAPEQYTIFSDYAIGRMSERMGSDYDSMLAGIKARYTEATGQKASDADINKEITNDFLKVVMKDEAEAVRLVQHDRTLGEKILQIIREVLQTLKETVVSKQDETYKLKTSELMKAERLFADALEKSKENYKGKTAEKSEAPRTVKKKVVVEKPEEGNIFEAKAKTSAEAVIKTHPYNKYGDKIADITGDEKYNSYEIAVNGEAYTLMFHQYIAGAYGKRVQVLIKGGTRNVILENSFNVANEMDELIKYISEVFGTDLSSVRKDLEQKTTEKITAKVEKVVENTEKVKSTPKPNGKVSTVYKNDNKIDDFGEKIGGAKKDSWSKAGLSLIDIAEMNDRELDKHIKKDNIWKKLDYQSMVDSGIPATVVYYIKTIKDSLDATPFGIRTSDNLEVKKAKQEQYLQTITEIKNIAEAMRTEDDVLNGYKTLLLDFGYIVKNTGNGYSMTEKASNNPSISAKYINTVMASKRGISNLKREVDKKQFGVAADDKLPKGYSINYNSKDTIATSFSAEGAEKWLPETYYITKGYRIIKINFDSKAEAAAWLKTAVSTQEEGKKGGKKRFVPEQLKAVHREGIDYRENNTRNAEGSDYLAEFGFKGGEFGNWMNQEDRQVSLNYGYDALMDLADALEIDRKDVSLNGTLSIAFGSRGVPGAAAHYEPTRKVFNLTKMNGAGSLFHEWIHALDDYVGVKLGLKSFVSENSSKIPSLNKLIETMKYKEGSMEDSKAAHEKKANKWVKNLDITIKNIFMYDMAKFTEAQKATFEKLKANALNGVAGSVEKLSEFRKEVVGRIIPKSERDNAKLYEHFINASKNDKVSPVRVETDYYKNSKRMGELHSKDGDYWESTIEMLARAGATYMTDKTKGKSDYLSGHSDSAIGFDSSSDGKLEVVRAYPTGEERVAINKAFDTFFAELKEKGFLTNREVDMENASIAKYSLKAGKATINQEKAIKEFGTTENFNEAGYLLADGQMLDFSGKNNGGEPNVRHMDHRDIQDIFEDEAGTDAMNKFISEGNIRIMAESPGVDMSSTIPPTDDQIYILKRFIVKSASKGYFVVDFSKEDGRPAGSLSYEGRPNYNKVVSDIQHYYATGELLVQSDVSRFSYSLKMNTKAIIEYAKLHERNEELKQQFNKSRIANKSTVETFAKELTKEYSSKYGKENITKDLQGLYDYLASGNPDFAQAEILAQKTAENILTNTVVLQDEMAKQYKELRNELRTTAISVSEADRKEFVEGYENFRKKNFGRLKLVNDGMGIDVFYTDLVNNYPDVFDEELTGVVDQLEEIARVYDMTTPFEENPYSANMAEAVSSLAMDLMDTLYIMPQTNARMQELKNEGKDRRKELLALENAMRKDLQRQASAKLKERLAKNRSKLNRKEKYKRILNISKDLLQRINKPTDKKHVPESLVQPLREFLSILSNKAGKDKLRDGLTKLRLTLANNLIVDNGVTYSNAIDEDFTKKIDELISELLQSESIPEMTEVEVNELYDIMKGVRKITREYNTLQFDGRKQIVDDLGSAVIQENYAKEDYQGKADGLRGMLDFDNLRSFAYFKKLGNTMYSLFQNLRTGQDTFFRNAEFIRQYMHKLRTNADGKLIDMTSWSGKEAKTTDFRLISGDTIKLTPAQVMSLYLLNKREQARYHIYNGGIRRADIFVGKKKNINSDVFKVKEADVDKITASLTVEQKKIADGIAEFFRTTAAQWGNEVSMKLFGYMKFKDENYFPIDVDRNSLTAMFGSVHEKSLQNNSSTIATVEKAANPIMLQDAVSVFSASASQMGLYNGIVVAINDMNKVMNFKPKDGKGVMGAIEKKFGKKAIDYYRRLIVDLNGGMRTEVGAQWLKTMLANFKAAKIGFNFRVIIQQPVSMVRAAGEINVGYLLRGIATQGGFEKAKKYAPITLWKSWGYFSNDIGRSLEDVFLDKTSLRDKLFFSPIQMADNVAWSKLWGAVELETKDKFPSLEVGSEEFYQECGRRFSYIVDETQVVDTTLHRSQLMRSDSDFAKVYTSFMSEPTIMYNKIYSAFEQAKSNPTKENIDKRNNALASSVASVVAVSFVTAFLFDAFKSPDDDDDKEKYLARALEALKNNMLGNVVGTIPFVKDIFSIIQGFTSERMELAGINDFIVSLKSAGGYVVDVVQGAAPKKNALLVVRDTLKTTADMFGIPASNFIKQVEMIFKNYIAQTNDYELVYHMEKLFTNINNSDNRSIYTGILTKELLQSRLDGDKTKAMAIYNDMILSGVPASKIESSVKGKITKTLTSKDEVKEAGMLVNEWNDLPEAEKTATRKSEIIAKYDKIVADLVKKGFTQKEIDSAAKKAAKASSGVVPSLDKFYEAYMKKDPNAEAMYDKLIDAGYTDEDLRGYIDSKTK